MANLNMGITIFNIAYIRSFKSPLLFLCKALQKEMHAYHILMYTHQHTLTQFLTHFYLFDNKKYGIAYAL